MFYFPLVGKWKKKDLLETEEVCDPALAYSELNSKVIYNISPFASNIKKLYYKILALYLFRCPPYSCAYSLIRRALSFQLLLATSETCKMGKKCVLMKIYN